MKATDSRAAKPVDLAKSSTHRPLGIRHRVGLKAVRVSHWHAGWVNVQDPIADQFHRLREDEYFLLCRLDGVCSLTDLQNAYQNRYPNRRVTSAQINSLLFRFHESGLTVSNSPGQGESLLLKADRARRQRWGATVSQWLFLRLPGVDPQPVMRWLVPWTRPVLSWPGAIVMAVFVLFSLGAMTLHQERFFQELPTLADWLTLGNGLILAAVVAATKIAHELGHAVVSERFGARCRHIGPMLLVFAPALYCDTSSSWMLASRWKRAAVAMAGIATELLIASAFVWVWLLTPPGLLHTTASNLIIVCGISTVFFNANPLLRYDGYYLLSDLTDVPNLGSRANRRLSGLLSWMCLGISDEFAASEPADRSAWLLVYAIASLIYRWTLMLTIIAFIWIALRPYGLEIVGQLAALTVAGGMVASVVIPIHRFWKNPSNRRKVRVSRFVMACLLFVGLMGVGFVPLPSPVIATARLIPRDETRVYVKTGGRLMEMPVRPGEAVREGDVLVRLDNPSLSLRRIEATSRYQEQLMRIDALRQSQTLVPEAATYLAAAEVLLKEIKGELQSIQQEQAELTITAPCSGRVVAAAGNIQNAGGNSASRLDLDDDSLEVDTDRLPSRSRSDVRLASWSGSPTDRENLNCFFSAGTELLSIADEKHWVAEVPVEASAAARIKIGAFAQVIWDAAPRHRITGRVVQIGNEKFDPRLDTVRRDHPDASQYGWTPQTRTLVSVVLEEPCRQRSSLLSSRMPTYLVGASGRVKIETEPRSIWRRAHETAASLFRFR